MLVVSDATGGGGSRVARRLAWAREPGEDWLWCCVDDVFVRAEVP